jgi:hypothetical protein
MIVLLLVSVAVPRVASGCTARADSNSYDPDHDYSDYDSWSSGQEAFDLRWETETLEQHLDFSRLCDGERKEEPTYRRWLAFELPRSAVSDAGCTLKAVWWSLRLMCIFD